MLVADCAFCGWFFVRQLLDRKVDFVIRLNQARTLRSRHYRSRQEDWEKPQRPRGHSKSSWRKRQKNLTVRLVRFRLEVRGFRTQSVIVVTSLLDVKACSDSAIAELSARRWQVELHFRQIKTNLALDLLRGLSPSMIEREIWMHAIGYNLLRAWPLAASLAHDVPIERLSLKEALVALQAWADCALRSRCYRRLARRTLLARLARRSRASPPQPQRAQRPKMTTEKLPLPHPPTRRMRVSTSRILR